MTTFVVLGQFELITFSIAVLLKKKFSKTRISFYQLTTKIDHKASFAIVECIVVCYRYTCKQG